MTGTGAPPTSSAQPSGIIYSLVARRNVVLAEFATAQMGNFITITNAMLEKIGPENGSRSYVYDQYAFHYTVAEGLIFLCMTDLKMQRRVCLGFLEDIKNRFFAMYKPEQIVRAIAFSFNAQFSPVLQKQMHFFSFDPSVDKLAIVKKQIEDTKAQMADNIEKLLERGDKIDLLVEQSENLENQSFYFKKQSKKLYWAVIVKNIKLLILISIILIICIWLATSLMCGFNYACLSFIF